jgi:hypothetical protein
VLQRRQTADLAIFDNEGSISRRPSEHFAEELGNSGIGLGCATSDVTAARQCCVPSAQLRRFAPSSAKNEQFTMPFGKLSLVNPYFASMRLRVLMQNFVRCLGSFSGILMIRDAFINAI